MKYYNGYGLIKAIREGIIKENTKIIVYKAGNYKDPNTVIYYKNGKLEWETMEFNTGYLFDDTTFGVEENKYIEELEEEGFHYTNTSVKEASDRYLKIVRKVNEIIREVNKNEKA